MRRYGPLYLPLLLVFLGAAAHQEAVDLFRQVPPATLSSLGTAGRPRNLPRQVYTERYAGRPLLVQALEQYYRGDHHTAYRTIDAHTALATDDAEALAWRALICYRQNNFAEAARSARMALHHDPDLGLAHLGLGLAFKGALRDFDWADQDSVLYHLQKAADLAPALTSPWQSLWVEAVLDGDADLETAALRGLAINRCFPPGLQEYSRWVLASLPEDALLLTNGDADTFPLLVLQQEEGLRPDVAIVNISLLNLEAYARFIAGRAGLPWPLTPRDLESTVHRRSADGGLRTRADQILERWTRMFRRGELARPVCWGLTVRTDALPGGVARESRILGGCYAYAPDLDGPVMDYEAVESSMLRIQEKRLMGNYVSPLETSPVRARGTNFVAGNAVHVFLLYARQALDEGQKGKANSGVSRAEILMRYGDLQDDFGESVRTLGQEVQEALHGN